MRYAEIMGAKKPRPAKSKPGKLDRAALTAVGLDPDEVVEGVGTPVMPCGPIVKHPLSTVDWNRTPPAKSISHLGETL
jgi:hypothetical protein